MIFLAPSLQKNDKTTGNQEKFLLVCTTNILNRGIRKILINTYILDDSFCFLCKIWNKDI